LELKNPTPNLEPQTTALHHPQLKAAYKKLIAWDCQLPYATEGWGWERDLLPS